jgi:hypothetical protein
MKTTLILIFSLAILPCVGQQSLFIKVDIGQSKHFNYGLNSGSTQGFSFNPVLSGGAVATLELSNPGIIRPYLGIGVSFLGTIHKQDDHPDYPGNTFRFRHTYLALPAGVNIPLYRSFGIDIAFINGWRLNDRSSQIIGNPRIWDVAVQPGVYVSVEQWRIGVSYYYGLRDVFGVGKIDEHSDLRLYNHAIYFNVAYKLKSFDKN